LAVAVAQLGARMHYAVPRILHSAGMLEYLYTDLCSAIGWPSILHHLPVWLLPNSLRKLRERVPHGIPAKRIQHFPALGLRYATQLRASGRASEKNAIFTQMGEEFCRRILSAGLGKANAVWTFNSAGLELLRHARSRGMLAIMEQTIAPKAVEAELLAAERRRWPTWEEAGDQEESVRGLIAREAAEWRASDLIVCGSDFVRDGVAQAEWMLAQRRPNTRDATARYAF
jgi:hypothetical protein